MLYQIISALVIITLVITPSQSQRCTTPNNARAQCRSIYECAKLYRLLETRPLPSETSQFLRESQCATGSGRPPYVCCGPDNGYVQPTSGFQQGPRVVVASSNGQGNRLPTPGQCGAEPPDNKIYKGKDTAIDEFPWMVLLEYREGNGRRDFPCGGALINQRYVLTAAHCLKGDIIAKKGTLISVRLGEYNTETEVDCVTHDKVMDCAPPAIDIGIEQIIPHPGYSANDVNRYNDIGLIRMSADVQYSDFIKPICIPPPTLRTGMGYEMFVSGWGRTLSARKSAIKQKLKLQVSNFNDCKNLFSTKRVALRDSQLCAGGKFAEDTCDGDSGNPLMKRSGGFWYVEGLVSFGNACGLDGWPGIYTRVNSFNDWIYSNLRP